VTTPIYYVNGQPHLGHAYTTLACDVLARFKRLDGHEVKFLTGTDEHGQKVEQSARAADETPLAFADRVSDVFRTLLGTFDFTTDDFIRTTEPRHREAVQSLWLKVLAKGDIYLGAYEGWYSIRDECFYGEDELVDDEQSGTRVAPTGAPVEWVAEESYFFRLSKYTQPLIDYITENPDFIRPAGRRNEVLAFMRDGLRDLSISRTTFAWGVPVPADPADATAAAHEGHVMYVWFDALTNYLSAVGYPDEGSAEFGRFWPASVHIVGKDILRFHAIYWPAFLMSAGLPLPQRLFAHGWWTSDGQKMSKSIGNVVEPTGLVERYGCDQVRYFMINEVPFGSDGDFSHAKMADCINAKLSNDLGNLAYRTLSFAYKHCDGAIPEPGELTAADDEMLAAARGLLPTLRGLVDDMLLHRTTQQLNAVVQQANRYIDTQAPWALRKSDPARMGTVLWVLMETLRHVGILQQPITPTIATCLLDQLAVAETSEARGFGALCAEHALVGGTPLPEPQIVVPRYERPEEEVAAEAAKAEAAKAAAAQAAAEAEAAQAAANALSDEELAALEQRIREQGDAVRVAKMALKEGSGDEDAVSGAVSTLIELKGQLPAGHEMLQPPKKKKKKAKAK